jgi:hypothetical protein
VPLQVGKNTAAATTACANKSDIDGITWLKHQIGFIRSEEDVHHLILIDSTALVIANIIVCPFAKYEAAFLGSLTARSQDVCLPAADTGGYRNSTPVSLGGNPPGRLSRWRANLS